MDADDDDFITSNNDGYGLEDGDILTRWEEMLPPGISNEFYKLYVYIIYLFTYLFICILLCFLLYLSFQKNETV